MLTTITGDGQLRSRPLHTEAIDEDGGLWFIVGAEAPKILEALDHGGRVGVCYADLAHEDYVSITASARLVGDPQRKAELWSPTAEVWFPGGKEDPTIAVLHVTPERGEYWSGPASAGGKLLAFARAGLTGDVGGFGTQRKLEMKQASGPVQPQR